MIGFIVLLSMIVMHYLSDWVLQTDVVAKYKQKDNWKEYGEKYENDYKSVLNIHSVFWSICINAPIIILELYMYGPKSSDIYCLFITISIILNSLMHYLVDDLKANYKRINLRTDQLIHYGQILITFLEYFIFIYSPTSV